MLPITSTLPTKQATQQFSAEEYNQMKSLLEQALAIINSGAFGGISVTSFFDAGETIVTEKHFNRAIAYLPAEGGILTIPADAIGRISATIEVYKPIWLIHHGGIGDFYHRNLNEYIQVIGGIAAFKFTCPGIRFTNVRMKGNGQSRPIVGSKGVLLDIQKKASFFVNNPLINGTLLPGNFAFDHCSFYNLENSTWQENGMEGKYSFCDFVKFSQYGTYLANELLPDGGDLSFVGCNWYAESIDAECGVYQTSGGGAKFTSCKWNARDGGFMNYAYNGLIKYDTSDLIFNGGSIENIKIGCIKVGSVSGQIFKNININNMQIAPYRGTHDAMIDLTSIKGINIGGINFRRSNSGANTKAIRLHSCSDTAISANTYYTELASEPNVNDFTLPSLAKDFDAISKKTLRDFDIDTPGSAGAVVQPVPAESTFNDTFAPAGNSNTYRWGDDSVGTGKMTANNGLVMQPGSYVGNPENNRAAYHSLLNYDMRGRTIEVLLASVGNAGDPDVTSFSIAVGGGSRQSHVNPTISIQGNVLYGQYGDAVGGFGQTPFSIAGAKRLRMVIAGNGASFQLSYSGDGQTYTNLFSGAADVNSMSAATIYLFSGESATPAAHSPTIVSSVVLS